MHNVILSPIDPDTLIKSISEKVTANVLKAVHPHLDLSDPERLLSIEEASEYLNLSKATIYSKVSRNELPYIKKGRLYFSSAELLDYLKSGKRKTHAELEAEAHEMLNNKKGLSNG